MTLGSRKRWKQGGDERGRVTDFLRSLVKEARRVGTSDCA